MVFADFSGQVAFRKAATWLFGGLAVGLQPCREQLGCQVGFKIGLEGPSWAEVGPKMGPRGLQKLSCRILSLIAAPFWGARRARAHAYAHIGRRPGIAPR